MKTPIIPAEYHVDVANELAHQIAYMSGQPCSVVAHGEKPVNTSGPVKVNKDRLLTVAENLRAVQVFLTRSKCIVWYIDFDAGHGFEVTSFGTPPARMLASRVAQWLTGTPIGDIVKVERNAVPFLISADDNPFRKE